MHARTVGVKYARDLDFELVLAVIIEEQRFSAALAFVVTAARADRVDAAQVVFGLRMDFRVAVDFGSRGLQDARLDALGKPQHVDCAMHGGLGRLHRVELVVDRRGRAREVVDLVDFDVERKRDVVAHQLEVGVGGEVREVLLAAGEVIVHAQHVAARREQLFAQMRAEKAGTAGNQNFFQACSLISCRRLYVNGAGMATRPLLL